MRRVISPQRHLLQLSYANQWDDGKLFSLLFRKNQHFEELTGREVLFRIRYYFEKKVPGEMGPLSDD